MSLFYEVLFAKYFAVGEISCICMQCNLAVNAAQQLLIRQVSQRSQSCFLSGTGTASHASDMISTPPNRLCKSALIDLRPSCLF